MVNPQLSFEVPVVCDEDNDMLKELSTLKEFRLAVFPMDVDSALGSDGFGVGFYQSC